jgi:hypothetical protein
MSVAIIGYAPVMTDLIHSVDHVVSRISRYRVRQEFYPIFGVIFAFVSLVVTYAVGQA